MKELKIRFELMGETQTEWWLEINGEVYENLTTPQLHARIGNATNEKVNELVEAVHGTPEDNVPMGHGCPACGEQRIDLLEWKDDDATVVCGSCKHEYKP